MMEKNFFADIVGHGTIRNALMRAHQQNVISHAYLFSGPPGVGKYKIAWAFARMIQCVCGDNPSCGCLACELAEGQTHPDIFTVVPQGASVKIEQIREIQKDIQFPPKVGNYKIIIIDGIDRLTVQAANSLLKMLEEPPEYVIFLLLTAQVHSVLPTILSRCQHFMFTPVAEEQIIDLLEGKGVPQGQASSLAAVSGGIPGRAIEGLETGLVLRDKALQSLLDLKSSPRGKIWDSATILDAEKEQLLLLLEQISVLLRDCLVWKVTEEPQLILYKDCLQQIRSLADCSVASRLLAVQKEIDQARRMIVGNVNSRLVLETLCLKIQDVMVM